MKKNHSRSNVHRPRSYRKTLLHLAVSAAIAVTAGCQSMPTAPEVAVVASNDGIVGTSPDQKVATAPQRLVTEGIKAMDEGRLGEATEIFNRALKMDVTNPYFNFLNALNYHLRAKRGESQYLSLAEQGYKHAARFDATNAEAFYYLGQLYLDQRKFRAARDQFATAVLLKPDDTTMLFDLAAAAYYGHDPITAESALTRLREIFNEQGGDPRARAELARISAVNKAALNDPAQARAYFLEFQSLSEDDAGVRRLERRLSDWERAYAANVPGLRKVQMGMPTTPGDMDYGMDSMGGMGGMEGDYYGQDTQAGMDAMVDMDGFVDDQMVVVDVVIIETVEDVGTSMGVNLLKGLELQFGDPLSGTPAFSRQRTSYTDYLDSTQNQDSRTITRAIGIPAINYSLNIANAQSGRNEVLAQPTLVARPGQTSQFFSGVDISAAATSGGAGDSVSIQKQVGIKLTVTPEIAPNDVVVLNVQAERTFLTQPSSSVLFTFRMDTTKTMVNANVAMKFGQTLILSGLSERETENNRDGVPLLQDVPVVQYAFSQKTTSSYDKSVLILLTPHRTNGGVPGEEVASADPTTASEAVQRLKQYHPSWFPAKSTYETVLENLEHNSLFQEFRTGDMRIVSGDDAEERRARLAEIAKFLYY